MERVHHFTRLDVSDEMAKMLAFDSLMAKVTCVPETRFNIDELLAALGLNSYDCWAIVRRHMV